MRDTAALKEAFGGGVRVVEDLDIRAGAVASGVADDGGAVANRNR